MGYTTDKLDDVVRLLAPEVTYTVPGRNAISGVFHGRDEVKHHLASLLAFSSGTYDVLKWIDWMAGDSHVAALLSVQLQRNGVKFRGQLMYLVETDHNDALSDIRVLFEDEEDANRFFSG